MSKSIWSNLNLENFETELNSNLNSILESKKDDLKRKSLLSNLVQLIILAILTFIIFNFITRGLFPSVGTGYFLLYLFPILVFYFSIRLIINTLNYNAEIKSIEDEYYSIFQIYHLLKLMNK